MGMTSVDDPHGYLSPRLIPLRRQRRKQGLALRCGRVEVFGGYNRWMTTAVSLRATGADGRDRRRAVGAAARPFITRSAGALVGRVLAASCCWRRRFHADVSAAAPAPSERGGARERPPEKPSPILRQIRCGAMWRSAGLVRSVALKTDLVEDYMSVSTPWVWASRLRGACHCSTPSSSSSDCRFRRLPRSVRTSSRRGSSARSCRRFCRNTSQLGRSRASVRQWRIGRRACSAPDPGRFAAVRGRPHRSPCGRCAVREGIEQRVVRPLDARDAHGLVRDEPVIRALVSRRAEGDR